MWDISVIFKALSKVINLPLGENSPYLVNLFRAIYNVKTSTVRIKNDCRHFKDVG
jgi:hypothetical protein